MNHHTDIRPPKWPLKFLRFFIKKSYIEEIEGDLEEIFYEQIEKNSIVKARRSYAIETLKLLRPILIKNLEGAQRLNFYGMLKNYFKISWRNLVKNPLHSFINVSGLTIAITIAILIFAWISFELSYDHYHEENNKVFWVMCNDWVDGEIETNDETPITLSDYIKQSIPEAQSTARMDRTGATFSTGEKKINIGGYYSDAAFFDMFHPAIIAGDPSQLLPDNNSVVISEKLAEILFDDSPALGKIVSLDLRTDLKVTGVYASFPTNSSFSRGAEFILPFNLRKRNYDEDWEVTMVKLTDANNKLEVERKIDLKFKELFESDETKSLLFCFTDWRLRWNFENGKMSGGRIVYVIIFGVAALFILVMACVNHMNLATAKATNRLREIGVRKMTGATRTSLIGQFFLESLTLSMGATLFAILFAKLLLPSFNEFTGIALQISLFDSTLIIGLICIALITGLLAGSYPALLLSSLKPALVLKGNVKSVLTGGGVRKSLVVFQFSLSVIMIFSAVIIWQQINFLLKKDLGYAQDNVLYVEPKSDLNFPSEEFKNEISNHSSILAVGIGAASPMEINGASEVSWPEKKDNTPLIFNGASVDYDYLPTLGFEFVQGRNFSREYATDSLNFIITEKAASLLGFADPIGHTIKYKMYGEEDGKIIGVIKDFHNDDIHLPINPVIFAFGNGRRNGPWGRIFVRYQPENLDEALTYLKSTFDKFQPGIPMSYGFLDKDFENMFYMERFMRKLSITFTIIAIVIACLGLFGLTLFNAQRRTKEIGVRKVLGASVIQLVMMLCGNFFKPILISFVIAFPIAYLMMERFLQGYVFRTTISVDSFLIVIGCLISIVLLTVLWQSVQAARKNPTEALKTE